MFQQLIFRGFIVPSVAALFPKMFFFFFFSGTILQQPCYWRFFLSNILKLTFWNTENMLAMTHPWDESGIFIYMETIKISHENVGKYINSMDPMGQEWTFFVQTGSTPWF